MVINNKLTLEEQLQTEINTWRTKQRQAQEAMKTAELDEKRYGDMADQMEKTLQMRRDLFASTQDTIIPNTDLYLKQSTWLNLRTIMKANGGILVVNDATRFLTEMNVFNDRDHARHTIYTTIHNHKPELKKIREGIYSLKETIDRPKEQAHEQLGNPMSFKNGVSKVIQDANGETVERTEIWHRMQAMGIKSNSKNPIKWIDWNAQLVGAEKVLPNGWRWPSIPKLTEQKPRSLELALIS